MLYFANWKVLLICGACLLGVLLSLPNLFTPAQLAYLPHFIPKKQVALGLDLRGGSYLLLHVDVDAAQRERLNSITDSVRNTLRSSEEHTSELQSPVHLVCRLLLEKKNKILITLKY